MKVAYNIPFAVFLLLAVAGIIGCDFEQGKSRTWSSLSKKEQKQIDHDARRQLRDIFIGDIDLSGNVVSSSGKQLNNVSMNLYHISTRVREKVPIDGTFDLHYTNVTGVGLWFEADGHYSDGATFSIGADVTNRNASYKRCILQTNILFTLEAIGGPEASLEKYSRHITFSSDGPSEVGKFTWDNFWTPDVDTLPTSAPPETAYFVLHAETDGTQISITNMTRIFSGSFGNTVKREAVASQAQLRIVGEDCGIIFHKVLQGPNASIPRDRRRILHEMKDAPVGPYTTSLIFPVSPELTRVYFFVKIHGKYGKGWSRLDSPSGPRTGTHSRINAFVEFYMQPDGTRNVRSPKN